MKISVKKIICIAGIVLAAAVIIIIIISIVSYSTLQSKPIAYDIPEAGEIHIKKDIVYKNTGKRDLMMDLYLPANIPGEKKPPVIVMVHGDSITAISPNPKNWGIFSSYGTLFAKKGYAWAAFTHRMLDILQGFDINADKIY